MAEAKTIAKNTIADIYCELNRKVFLPGNKVFLEVGYQPKNVPAELFGHSLDYTILAPGFVPHSTSGTLNVGLDAVADKIKLEAGIFPETTLSVLFYHGRSLIAVGEIPIIKEENHYVKEEHLVRRL